jgi:hypothetical protein
MSVCGGSITEWMGETLYACGLVIRKRTNYLIHVQAGLITIPMVSVTVTIMQCVCAYHIRLSTWFQW